MSRIVEWTPLLPKLGEESKPSAVPGAVTAAKKSAPGLPEKIHARLIALKPRAPVAVHFYLGEGLRWIRVGFGGEKPIGPTELRSVGEVIQSCLAKSDPLYFHALRPLDMLFFLEGGDEDSMGMPAEFYGTPLRSVLAAWRIKAPVAARKTSSRRASATADPAPRVASQRRASKAHSGAPVHSMTEAPHSQRPSAKS